MVSISEVLLSINQVLSGYDSEVKKATDRITQLQVTGKERVDIREDIKQKLDKAGIKYEQKKLPGSGFEGIEIVFPQNEIESYKEKLTEISNLPEDFFRENKVRKENILEAVKGFIDNFESGIPTKAEMSHLIVFNPNKIQKEFLLTLPKAPEPERDERFTPIKKGLYWSDKKVTMDDLTKKEMSFDHSTEMTM